MRGPEKSQRNGRAYVYLLFLIPFVALLLPIYLRDVPRVGGLPFFYWYQFACLIVSAALTWIVYRVSGAEP
jgi:Protein of unknown function (DUF3311)